MRREVLNRLLELERGAPPANPAGEPARIELAEVSGEETVLRLYGPIGPWDADRYIGAEAVASALARVSTPAVRARIQSPGGSAVEGFAIYQQLRTWPGRVITQVDGMAASAAGLVFLAGAERLVPKSGALVMLHEARLLMLAGGAKGELRKVADETIDLLEKFDAEIAAIVAERSGMSESEAAAAIEKTTWYRPAEALGSGIATGQLPAGASVAPGIRPGARNQLALLGASAALLAELPAGGQGADGSAGPAGPEAAPSGLQDDGKEFLGRLQAAEMRRFSQCA